MRIGPRFVSVLRTTIGPLAAAAAGVSVVLAIVLTDHDAGARSAFDSSYGYDRTWNAALRMVRVDMNFKVTEKDEQNGYLIFEYKTAETNNKPSSGSMELVRSKDPDQPVHVIVQLTEMPRYHEQVMLDSLARKMRQEYGDPPAHPPHPVTPPDAGSD